MKFWISFAIFLGATTVLADNTLRKDCREDRGNVIPNTCLCDIYTEIGTGTVQLSCDEVACEEFAPLETPAECTPNHKGLHCFVTHQLLGYYQCNMTFPRLDTSKVPDAGSFCNNAVADINKKGSTSRYYSHLSRNCVPSGLSYPPTNGWHYLNYRLGWD